ncbi:MULTISPECIES: hypothetical protein [unclassified Brevibacillus]|uniref:hypothetical protein n=1 Tax=unclassified Brevibacillus TaxID=2684853 RepID=UPI00156B652F|nr:MULTISPECIES: hypothetical protein [unclassified Brevibacillus]MCM3142562.1 hypothetical protein [Brevibacillus sp. MER 51]NRR20463.1 hypothetical protein [Brevibacillus sp. MS2.2]
MSKKDYILTIIEKFEKHNDMMPERLQAVIKEVKQDIENVPAETFYLQTNGVVTHSATSGDSERNNPLFRLSEVYFDLKKLAETNRDTHPDLISAITQYEGLLNESEGYSPE